jgi:hypothetical protein
MSGGPLTYPRSMCTSREQGPRCRAGGDSGRQERHARHAPRGTARSGPRGPVDWARQWASAGEATRPLASTWRMKAVAWVGQGHGAHGWPRKLAFATPSGHRRALRASRVWTSNLLCFLEIAQPVVVTRRSPGSAVISSVSAPAARRSGHQQASHPLATAHTARRPRLTALGWTPGRSADAAGT